MDVRTVVSTGTDLLAFFSGDASNHDDVSQSLLAPLSTCPSSVFFIYAFPASDVASPRVVPSLLGIGRTSAQHSLGFSVLGRSWDDDTLLLSLLHFWVKVF